MVYELTLLEFLRTDYEGFLVTLQMWDPALYNLSSISKVMVEKLELQTENPVLMKAMAIMFGYQRKFQKSMAVYIKYVVEVMSIRSIFHDLNCFPG